MAECAALFRPTVVPDERNRLLQRSVTQLTATAEEVLMATERQQKKVEKVMHEHKHGTLKSGSGKKVKSRKQAIAIAMYESGQSRKRKTSSRKTSSRKTASHKKAS